MSRFAYFNLGYNIMGLALARVAKQPYTQYVDQRILKPLGMNQSGFALTLSVPELRPGSVVYMKEIPLEPFGDNVFRVDGGSFYGNFITFESSNDGIIALKWRNYTFNRQH